MLTYLAGTSRSFCFLAATALNWAVGVVSWATSLVVGVRSLGTFWPSSLQCSGRSRRSSFPFPFQCCPALQRCLRLREASKEIPRYCVAVTE